MKKSIVLFFVTLISYCVTAQVLATDKTDYTFTASPWCIDLNLNGGIVSQNAATINMPGAYLNPVYTSIRDLRFSTGYSFGFDGQLGYFFCKNKRFGIGTGMTLQIQKSKLYEDKYSVTYQSFDDSNNTFRQIISAGKTITESLTTTNLSVPLVFKYKTQIRGKLGFTADAGIIYNLVVRNSYSTNASFDYQAIYKYSLETGSYVYDNAIIPGKNDLEYTIANTHGNVTQRFNNLRTVQGINVGIARQPLNSNGKVSYKAGSLGVICHPELTYAINERASFNYGVYFVYEAIKNNANSDYRLTNKVGEYNSLLNAVTANNNFSYGLDIGLRYYFGKAKDRDHDGTPDRLDRCPTEWGLSRFNGCPDADMDGIPDIDDSCPHEYGLLKFNGCPDSDGDGIIDKNDSCPHQFGLAAFNGCPDTDGDGIPDKNDSCPRQAGLPKFFGCPDSDGDGIPDNLDACPFVAGTSENSGCPDKISLEAARNNSQDTSSGSNIESKDGKKERKKEGINDGKKQEKSNGKKQGKKDGINDGKKQEKSDGKKRGEKEGVESDLKGGIRGAKNDKKEVEMKELDRKQVHFDFNKTILKRSSYKYLDGIVKTMKEHPETIMTIDGFSDNVGPVTANIHISKERALAVKKYMIKKGISKERLRARGLGKRKPVASNKTRKGRARNRRALMVVKSNVKYNKDHTVSNSSAIDVYPNEEKGSFTIVLKTNFEENAVVKITNNEGKVVKEFNIIANKPTEFTLDGLAGLYSFTAETATTKYEARIIISQ